VAAYRDPERKAAKTELTAAIEASAPGVPEALVKLRALGRTLKQRAADVLAYFDRPGTSNAPTEPIIGRLDTSAARPSASATSPATPPAPCSTPASSDPRYTLICDEPVYQTLRDSLGGVAHGAGPHSAAKSRAPQG
jgi:hypothetical protein